MDIEWKFVFKEYCYSFFGLLYKKKKDNVVHVFKPFHVYYLSCFSLVLTTQISNQRKKGQEVYYLVLMEPWQTTRP